MESNINEIITQTIKDVKNILDINSIIGSPIKISDSVSIIPICKMSMGLVTGGGDIGKDKFKKSQTNNYLGGSGTGLSFSPVGIITVVGEDIKYISLDDPIPYYDIVKTIENIASNILKKVDNNGKNVKK